MKYIGNKGLCAPTVVETQSKNLNKMNKKKNEKELKRKRQREKTHEKESCFNSF